ncbi:unnamed protein product [Onchocerca flexuosa]|uniref:RNB domain-containing protein n=1 Tax=Onchocerca flexuosa TaxID=387005 RepID=A0A183HP37_9BILA|nr:unnamed protein product [Onchocerca flexuosa]
MHSVKWQKILIWLYDKIISNEIDRATCAEISDADVNKGFYDVVMKNMIHGPCSTLSRNLACMTEENAPSDILDH